MTPIEKIIAEFEEKFPARQKEATHFDYCECWGCNNYRDNVKSFLCQSLLTIDTLARKEERERIEREAKKMIVDVPTKMVHLKNEGINKSNRRASRVKAETHNKAIEAFIAIIHPKNESHE